MKAVAAKMRTSATEERERARLGFRAIGPCAVEGCGGFGFRGPYCERCRQEIEALHRMAAERARKRAPARRRTPAVWAAVNRRLWIANLVLVATAAAWLVLVYGTALAEWIRAGGWR